MVIARLEALDRQGMRFACIVRADTDGAYQVEAVAWERPTQRARSGRRVVTLLSDAVDQATAVLALVVYVSPAHCPKMSRRLRRWARHNGLPASVIEAPSDDAAFDSDCMGPHP